MTETHKAAALITLGAADHGSTVQLTVGDLLEVVLEGNPSTGYMWTLAPDSGVLLAQQGQATFQPNSGALGSGSMMTWRFQAIAHGEMLLKLRYQRSFEPDKAPLKQFAANLTIKQ
ncbi:inhibitor of cysteine peptidase [Thiothrix caldifontis]|uniref:Inhibitor of cysteine peptidase n=1 Tax=Thiothrix caldifontis TaxID=525918 RepID=A0A1H3ZNB1_9GAMM|nr:protease inhibitor I42 family protein [Thiothrix caldifontis]SEA24744.1 inhibitor of cysteine peptidase [Thiothrix caldifontis]